MAIAYERALTTAVVPRLRSPLRVLPLTALALDAVLVAVTVIFAAYGRNHVPFFGGAEVSRSAALVGLPLAVAWIAVIALRGGYDRGVFGAGADEYKTVVGSSLFAAAILGIGCYLTQFDLSRGFYLFTFLIGPGLLASGRYLLRRWLHIARRNGALALRTVIVGSADHVDAVASVFERETWLGYDVLGALTPATDSTVATDGGVPVLGEVREAADLIRAYEADVVLVAGGGFDNPQDMRGLVWDLEADDVQVIMAPGVTDVSSERIRVRPVGGLPLLHVDRPRHQEALRWAKRTFDIAGSAFILALAAPLMLWTAWKIKRHDGGPVLFRQTRVGADGSFFTCLKFRSMVVDAERVLANLHDEVGYTEGLFKMRQDPRITKPGQWIRRFSLDELPQLMNVLRGDMSLVGPRPPLPTEVDRYTLTQSRRLRVRPGMTGLWQVSGRSDLSWDESVRLDLYYVDNWSMIQDLLILGRTAGAVLSSRGAY
ncbi:MAG TPA: sugar transferase [Nocardioides sp.]|jgi:exopolysaccharide biosynthesis polyprenyl glycosylphosphotransferase|uniref:sugar transferase n=1 Tax=Nocardioides sp. TaxID=35761 RepID=UPI002E2F100C|nr:sugar transferase [Nocardioides sp.]HEX3932699.1 sugar transferase [Nocardioides sp.]